MLSKILSEAFAQQIVGDLTAMAETGKRAAAHRYLVFVSHSTADRWIAKQIANQIETKTRKYGVKTFIDEKDIEGGDSIPESIRKSIRGCDEFLVLLTPCSIHRPWVLTEIGAAWILSKRITAIIDKISPDELPDVIIPYKAIDLNQFDEYIGQLTTRAKKAKGGK